MIEKSQKNSNLNLLFDVKNVEEGMKIEFMFSFEIILSFSVFIILVTFLDFEKCVVFF
jgi:hypothetical protein